MNNRIPCAVTADLNRHIRSIDRDEARQLAVDEECANLMSGEYSPSDFQNIIEAISEMTEEVTGDIAVGVRSAIEHKDTQARNLCYQVIGKNVTDFVAEYWKRKATVRADENIEQSCLNCFGRGCKSCYEP